MRPSSLLPLLLSFTACGPHKGKVDLTTGLQGIEVAPGSLAGAWALVMEMDLIVPAGVLGDQAGGFRAQYLLTRTWDSAGKQYTDTWRRCAREGFPIVGTRTLVPNGTWPKLLPYTATSTAEHTAGAWSSGDVVELWGVHNLPDPLNTPLPSHADYLQSPQQDWVFDEDQDGNPAVTELSHGGITGQMFEVERIAYRLDGTILSGDRVQGLATLLNNSANRLEADSSLLMGESTSRQDDGRVSWFDSIRLTGAGPSCDDVAAAVAAGSLATAKPF